MEIQKKWFIYIGDHHEGPFTVEEVRKREVADEVSDQTYVWCEGMLDWLPLSEVPALLNELKKVKQLEAQASAERSIETAGEKDNPVALKNKFRPLYSLGLVILGITVVGFGGLILASRFAPENLHASLRPTFIKVANQFPFLSSSFRLVPPLNDVKPEDLKELEQAQVGLPENEVKIALALSQNDSVRPYFYISTNLPHHTQFEVLIQGIGDTLLNRLQYSTQVSVTTQYGFGKSEVIFSEGGQPLPKGEYQIFVFESNEQDSMVTPLLSQYPPLKLKPAISVPTQIPSASHFVFTKTVFIGGPRDEIYLTRLKAFHDKIKQNAEREFLELKQYADTLSLQLTGLTAEFEKIRKAKKISAAHRVSWRKTADTWQQINGQLSQTIQTWSKETLENEYFYGKAFELVKNAFESLKNLFTLENGFIENPTQQNVFDIEHAKTLSEAKQNTDLLRVKIDAIQNAPKTADGLPTREGL